MKLTTAISALAAVGSTFAQDCPAPGTTNSNGDEVCDPATQQPSGLVCVLGNDGCYFLEGLGLNTASPTSSTPSSTPTCLPPGTRNPLNGDESCDPSVPPPDNQLCVLKDGCYYLEGTGLLTSTPTSSTPSSTPTCLPPGTRNPFNGDESCDPSVQPPSGLLCVLKDGCYYLEGTGLLTSSPTTSSSSTPTCVPPGTVDPLTGDETCDPAQQYPDGQFCVLKNNGCYYLEGTGLIIPSSTSSAGPTSTNCPAPGTTNSDGDEVCDPTQAQPTGLVCVLGNDGCYFLEGLGGLPSSGSAGPSSTISCLAPGTTDASGDESCDPTKPQPSGLVCVLMNGCYFLEGLGVVIPSSSTNSSSGPYSTPLCPAPGSYNGAGYYACNPAHQYPGTSKCVLMGGCYYLQNSNGTSTTTTSSPGGVTSSPGGITSSPGGITSSPGGITSSPGGIISSPAGGGGGGGGGGGAAGGGTPVGPTVTPPIPIVAGGVQQTAFAGLAAAVALLVALI